MFSKEQIAHDKNELHMIQTNCSIVFQKIFSERAAHQDFFL